MLPNNHVPCFPRGYSPVKKADIAKWWWWWWWWQQWDTFHEENKLRWDRIAGETYYLAKVNDLFPVSFYINCQQLLTQLITLSVKRGLHLSLRRSWPHGFPPSSLAAPFPLLDPSSSQPLNAGRPQGSDPYSVYTHSLGGATQFYGFK